MNNTAAVNDREHRAALVTGGAGFIGSHVAEALHALGWHVEVLDNLSAGNPANVPPGVRLHIGDIRSERDLRAVFNGGRFNAVIHCAAQTSVERSMRDPNLDREINVGGTRQVAMRAKASGLRRFVLISSGGAIYGETSEPATEQTPPAPRSHYGLHKCHAEEVLRAEGPPCAVLRPSNVYGPRQRADAEGGAVAIFFQRLLAGEPLDIHGSGRQVRDFVHVSDVVAAVLVALTSEGNAIWNVASGQATSIIALAEEMAALTGHPVEIRHQPRRAGDVYKSLLTATQLLATGLWGPPIPLARGLRLTLAATVDTASGAGPIASLGRSEPVLRHAGFIHRQRAS
jgi:UDP-glucose 4-epimerase